jgi:hypothetical protein
MLRYVVARFLWRRRLAGGFPHSEKVLKPAGKMPAPHNRGSLFLNRKSLFGLAAVAEEHYVAFLHDVFLAFETHLRALAGHAQTSCGK